MIGGEFKLCFADIEIAEVQHKESDFPNDFGSWTPLPLSVDVELHRHLREYIAYSIESSRLLDETNAGPEWEDFIGREESRYLDLIEAETWYLVDSSGGRTSILIPIFHHDGGLVWRWNTARFGEQ